MPSGAPTVISSPLAEPLSFDEVNAHRQGSIPDDQKDYVNNILIPAARELCEETLGISLMPQTLQMALDGFPGQCFHGNYVPQLSSLANYPGRLLDPDNAEIAIHRPPLKSIESVRYTSVDGQDTLWDPANYMVDTFCFPGRLLLGWTKQWPYAQPVGSSVRIRYQAGFRSAAEVPARLKQGMLLVIGALYENRESSFTSERNASSVTLVLNEDTRSAVDSLWKRYKVT